MKKKVEQVVDDIVKATMRPGSVDAAFKALVALPDVTHVEYWEVAFKGGQFAVEGGADAEIARAIWSNVEAIFETFGEVEVTHAAYKHPVRFSRKRGRPGSSGDDAFVVKPTNEPEGESDVKPARGFRDRVAEAEANDAAAMAAERDAKYPPAPPPWRWERGDIGHAGHYPDGRLVASDGTEILERGGGDGSGRPPNDLSPDARELIRLAPEMEAALRAVEWSGTLPDTAGGGSCCPVCECEAEPVTWGSGGTMIRHTPRHTEECEIGRILAALDAARRAT